jgi:hypothetical protein
MKKFWVVLNFKTMFRHCSRDRDEANAEWLKFESRAAAEERASQWAKDYPTHEYHVLELVSRVRVQTPIIIEEAT